MMSAKTVLLAFTIVFFCTMEIYHIEGTFWKLNHDQQQWTNNIQASDTGTLIYIPMLSSQYPTTAHEPLTNYIAQRNHLFTNGAPAKKSIIQRTSEAPTIPPSSLQYSSYTHSPATYQQEQPLQHQHQQHYPLMANQAVNAQFSNPVDEYLLHGEMPLPQDQTYIVSNAAPNIATHVEPDYLT